MAIPDLDYLPHSKIIPIPVGEVGGGGLKSKGLIVGEIVKIRNSHIIEKGSGKINCKKSKLKCKKRGVRIWNRNPR